MKKVVTIVSVLFVSLSYFGDTYFLAHWQLKWGVALFFTSFYIALQLGRRLHWSFFLPVFWTLLSGVWVMCWHPTEYSLQEPAVFAEVRAVAASALATFAMMAFLFFSLGKDERLVKYFEKALALLCVALTGQVFFLALHGLDAYHRGGVIGNASMAGCLIACLFPFLNFSDVELLPHKWLLSHYFGIFCFIGPIAAVIMCGASIPIGVLGIVLALSLLKNSTRAQLKLDIFDFLGTLFVFGVIIGIGYLFINSQHKIFFRSDGRFDFWRDMMVFWKDNLNHVYGAGLDLSVILIPHIQSLSMNYEALHSKRSWWIWFHNDWIQCLFEMGIVGLVAWVIFYVELAKRAWKHEYLFSVVVAYGAMAFFNYPMHLAPHAYLGCVVVWMLYQKELGLSPICTPKLNSIH